MTRSEVSLERVLREQEDQIVRRFVQAVERRDLPPGGTSRSSLEEHLPRFLGELRAELAQPRAVRDGRDGLDHDSMARRDGDPRWSPGYDLKTLVREYEVLRHCILETAREAGVSVTIDQSDTIAKCLNVAVAEAAAAYEAHRDEQLKREREHLELLAEASRVLGASLDYPAALSRLTRLVVPRLADACVIRLDGQDDPAGAPIAHVDPRKERLLRELYGLGTARQEGATQGSTDADDESERERALLRRLEVRSWFSVPLKLQETALGTMVLYYGESRRSCTSSDVVVAEELARRAAVAIQNAKLHASYQADRARMEDATRAKEQFVAMVSHELRAPLNAVLGWTRMLRSGMLPTAKHEHALEIIERNTLTQNQLIDDLLDISRIIAGTMRVNAVELDLSAIVELAIESVRPAAEAKRVTILTALEREGASVRADGERMRRVASLLLSNAIQFSPRGSNVDVRLRRVGTSLELSVTDAGAGIDPEALPFVFEQFRRFREGPTRTREGLGVGLAIVKHLVELHGGSVEARSPGAGRGATFVVKLPLHADADADTPRRSARLAGGAEPAFAAELAGVRVLVVEDEPDTREVLGAILEACGATVTLAQDVVEGLRLLEASPPDVLISDIGMPDHDGYALIRAVRSSASDGNRDVPALALTAYARAEDRVRALAAGFTAYATKPIEPATLVGIVVDLARRNGHARSG